MSENIKNKPIVEMNDFERERMWDEFSSSIDVGMLDDARQHAESVRLAVVVLTLTDGTRRILSYSCEYGDGEGLKNESDQIRRIRRTNRLKEGESVDRFVIELPHDEALSRLVLRSVPVKPPKRRKR